jgi:hypothetical protein
MMECVRAFTANGERFEAGPGIVTRVTDRHPILRSHGSFFADDPDQLGTLEHRAERLTGPTSEERNEVIRRLEAERPPSSEERFWDSTSRFLARVEDPNGERARGRLHEEWAAVADRAEAARAEAEIGEAGGWVEREVERRRRWKL